MLVNLFPNFRFGDGWALKTAPNIIANWSAKAGQQWTVPVGGELGKTFHLGIQPVQFFLDVSTMLFAYGQQIFDTSKQHSL
jgi:hypothetical protein